MELSDYFGIARRRWWMVVAAGLLCALASGGWSFTQAKAYTAETRLLVPAGSQTSEARTEAALSAQAYAQLAGTPPAVDAALGLAGVHGASVQSRLSRTGRLPFWTSRSPGQNRFRLRKWPIPTPRRYQELYCS